MSIYKLSHISREAERGAGEGVVIAVFCPLPVLTGVAKPEFKHYAV